jgi:hypothetical protein
MLTSPYYLELFRQTYSSITRMTQCTLWIMSLSNIFVQTERGTIDQLLSAISDGFSYSDSRFQAMNLAWWTVSVILEGSCLLRTWLANSVSDSYLRWIFIKSCCGKWITIRYTIDRYPPQKLKELQMNNFCQQFYVETLSYCRHHRTTN